MLIFVSLAIGCAGLGILMTFVLLMACQHFGIDLSQNLWLITLPIVIAIVLNILSLELYDKFKKK
jgi:exosortase/archaeosortase family protein